MRMILPRHHNGWQESPSNTLLSSPFIRSISSQIFTSLTARSDRTCCSSPHCMNRHPGGHRGSGCHGMLCIVWHCPHHLTCRIEQWCRQDEGLSLSRIATSLTGKMVTLLNRFRTCGNPLLNPSDYEYKAQLRSSLFLRAVDLLVTPFEGNNSGDYHNAERHENSDLIRQGCHLQVWPLNACGSLMDLPNTGQRATHEKIIHNSK